MLSPSKKIIREKCWELGLDKSYYISHIFKIKLHKKPDSAKEIEDYVEDQNFIQ